MLYSLGRIMKKSIWDTAKHNLAPTTDNKFWRSVDKLMDATRTRTFFYSSVGMLIVGTILGVVAPYFK